MPELGGLDASSLALVLFATVLSGVTYGFAGFGAALIFMPIAAQVAGPQGAITVLSLTALGSVISVLPGALRQADLRAVGWMLVPAVAVLPAGVWLLRHVDEALLRWVISGLVLVTLAALLTGWRYRGRPGPLSWAGVGAAVGLFGGSTGLNGPPVILFQLGGQDSVARSRGNTIVVLTTTGFLVLPALWMQGGVEMRWVILGLCLVPVYALAGYIGRRLFDPERASVYRGVAYVIVAAAAIMGLPIWR